MSKLEELIQRLCPDGVEYKKLGDIATITRGGNLQKKDFTDTGIPCIHYGQIYTKYGLFADKTFTFISKQSASKQKYAEPNDIVMAVTSENLEDVCKCVAWLGDVPAAVSGHTAIIHHSQNPKYLCYYFHSDHFQNQKNRMAHGTKVMEVTPNKLTDILLPIPPLEIQSEIVRILDSFTELSEELITRLSAELAARKKQYEYYQNKLLTFEKNVPYYTLSEVCDIVDYRGKTPKKVENGIFLVTAKNIKKGYIDYDKSKEYVSPDEYSEIMRRGLPQVGDVLITTEAPCGNVAQVDRTDIALAQRVIKYRANSDMLDNKFLKYVLLGAEFQTKLLAELTGGTVKGIKGSKLHRLSIPVPPLNEQRRIVSILDRFDALCNDLTRSLSIEIEAQQKQYEYYRDKLLTFQDA